MELSEVGSNEKKMKKLLAKKGQEVFSFFLAHLIKYLLLPDSLPMVLY